MACKLFYPLFILLLLYPWSVWGAAITTEDAFYQGNIEFYPKPVPVLKVKREADITQSKLSTSYRKFPKAKKGTQNKGVRIRIAAVELVHEPKAKQGDIKLARGSGYPKGLIDQTKAGDLELGVVSMLSSKPLQELRSSDGRKLLTARLIGKSNIRKGGRGNITQIDADKYVWLEGDGGFIYPVSWLNKSKRKLRFTPEYFSSESISFLVPENLLHFRIAVRNGSEISYLNLSEDPPESPPAPFKSFLDGKVAEWHFYSISRTKNGMLVDMGVQGHDLNKGLEIKPYRQIRLGGDNKSLKPDKMRSQALAFGAREWKMRTTWGKN